MIFWRTHDLHLQSITKPGFGMLEKETQLQIGAADQERLVEATITACFKDPALPKYWQSLLSLTESDDTVWKVLSLQAVERSLEHQPINHNISQSCEDSIGVCLDWLHFSRKFHAFGIALWANSWSTTIMYFSTIDIYCFNHWGWSCNRIFWTEVNGFDHAVLMFEQKSLIVTT